MRVRDSRLIGLLVRRGFPTADRVENPRPVRRAIGDATSLQIEDVVDGDRARLGGHDRDNPQNQRRGQNLNACESRHLRHLRPPEREVY